jgi:hypothetical protein
MAKLFNGGINVRGLRKSFNDLIEKHNVNFCTLTEEEAYDIGSLKRAVEVVRDTITPLEEGRGKDRGVLLLENMKQHILNLEYGITKAPKYNTAFKRNAFISAFGTVSMLFCIVVMLVYGFDVAACVDVVLGAFLAISAGIGAREEVR